MAKSTEKKVGKGKNKSVKGKGVEKRSSSVPTVKVKGSKTHNQKGTASISELPSVAPLEEERTISITIEIVRNISTRVPGREITIHVQDVGDFSFDSPHIQLTDAETSLNCQFNFPCFPGKPGWLDEIAANPLLFTVFEEVRKEKEKTGEKDKDKKKDSKILHDISKEEKMLGNCTLDLLPFLLGQTKLRQVLLVEQDFDAYGHEAVTWPNLPQLTVSATISEPLVPEAEVRESNLLFITLESLYNPTSNMSGELVYQAATGVPLSYNSTKNVYFDMGLWTEERDADKMKRWIGFANVGGRGAYSTYRLNRDIKSIKNKLRVDVAKKMNEETPRIEWNTLRRCWLSSSESEAVESYISRKHWWPLEIVIEEKSDNESNNRIKEFSAESTAIHLVAYFDVSALLHPGVTEVRVMSQVYTYCQEDVLGRCDLKRSFYAPPPEPEPAVVVESSKSSSQLGKNKNKQKVGDKKSSSKSVNKKSSGKMGEKKSSGKMGEKKSSGKMGEKKSSKVASNKKVSKTGTDKKQNANKAGAKDSKSGSKMESKASKSGKSPKDESQSRKLSSEASLQARQEFTSPLFTDDGQPVFILLEIEVMKPLRQKKPLEDSEKAIDKLVAERMVKPPTRTTTPQIAESQFRECIQMIGVRISEEYQTYIEKNGNKEEPCKDAGLPENFYKHLQDNGFYQSAKETLRGRVTDVVREKMKYSFDLKHPREREAFLSDLYVYLIEEIHTVINRTVENQPCKPVTYIATNEDLYFFAKVECEQQNFSNATRILEEILNREKKNPVWWLEFAVHWMTIEDWTRASQLVLEALSLDRRNMLGLLVYALLMSKLGEENTALVFFDALTSMYPRFVEGWVTFHLYSLNTRRHITANATLEIAQKVSTSLHKDTISAPIVDTEPIVWSTKTFTPDHSIFLQTAVLLMKLNATFYAELSLAQEFLYHGNSLEYAYYLGVNHYLERRYSDALVHVEEALVGHRRQMSLWSLCGHCYRGMGDCERTLEMYRFVVDSEEPVHDRYLVSLRLAEYHLKLEVHETSKELFLSALRVRQTPRAWFGVGISCYQLGEFFEAEKALTEANLLNNTCPNIWGYLALVNLQFHRQTEFEQCFFQAVKCDIQDTVLLKCINALRESLKYPLPCASPHLPQFCSLESLR